MPTTSTPPRAAPRLRRAADAEALEAYRDLQTALARYQAAMAKVRAQAPRRKFTE
jgi:hypothetical protein